MDKAVTEAELAAASKFPRVTPDQIEAVIADKKFTYTGLHVSCILTTKNGFSVQGESGCAVPGNYKREFGERLAYENAFNKLWPLLGYELKSKVALAQQASAPSNEKQKTYVGTKVIHAEPMTRAAYNILRGWKLPEDENGDDEGYLVEYPDQSGSTAFYNGYVSWSPKDVFESAYELMDVKGEGSVGGPTWLDRLEIEQSELSERLTKLWDFLGSPAASKLPENQHNLLTQQADHMAGYLSVLEARKL